MNMVKNALSCRLALGNGFTSKIYKSLKREGERALKDVRWVLNAFDVWFVNLVIRFVLVNLSTQIRFWCE